MTIAEHYEETLAGIVGLIIIILIIWWAVRERCQYCEHRVACFEGPEGTIEMVRQETLDRIVELRKIDWVPYRCHGYIPEEYFELGEPVIYTQEDLE